MNSFTVMAIGNLARDPELGAKGDVMYTRFCLVGNDYGGKDENGTARNFVTFLWFVAFGGVGEAIARNARKGDQLVVHAHVRANNWTDSKGDKQYDYSYIVSGFRFAAPGRITREALAAAAHAQTQAQPASLDFQPELEDLTHQISPAPEGLPEESLLPSTASGFPLL